MTEHDWNANYAAEELPWDTGQPDPALVEWFEQRKSAPKRALEIGCGTGTNALWLAGKGCEVLALDLAPLAIERARAKARAANAARCELQVRDFVNGPPLEGAFDLVFDRGCFHVFDEPEVQARFAQRVAAVLAPGGHWLSLIGSTEGAPREMGPPRRSARDITNALEPNLELVDLRAMEFRLDALETPPKAWFCLSRRRDVPAQPSTRWADRT
jgi:SAM-dependent methyltransferase